MIYGMSNQGGGGGLGRGGGGGRPGGWGPGQLLTFHYKLSGFSLRVARR